MVRGAAYRSTLISHTTTVRSHFLGSRASGSSTYSVQPSAMKRSTAACYSWCCSCSVVNIECPVCVANYEGWFHHCTAYMYAKTRAAPSLVCTEVPQPKHAFFFVEIHTAQKLPPSIWAAPNNHPKWDFMHTRTKPRAFSESRSCSRRMLNLWSKYDLYSMKTKSTLFFIYIFPCYFVLLFLRCSVVALRCVRNSRTVKRGKRSYHRQ